MNDDNDYHVMLPAGGLVPGPMCELHINSPMYTQMTAIAFSAVCLSLFQ